jgi:hypothetical protein
MKLTNPSSSLPSNPEPRFPMAEFDTELVWEPHPYERATCTKRGWYMLDQWTVIEVGDVIEDKSLLLRAPAPAVN